MTCLHQAGAEHGGVGEEKVGVGEIDGGQVLCHRHKSKLNHRQRLNSSHERSIVMFFNYVH